MKRLHIPGTTQEIFNKIYLGVVKQGKPSVGKNGKYMYRNENNLKCAVGQLIPDDKYHPDMESRPIGPLFSFDSHKTLDTVRALRFAHNSAADQTFQKDFVDQFKAYAENWARFYNLTIPEVE